jgi:ABC-2 type transport system permease protein
VLARLLPSSPAGAIAARTLRTKVRTPRQAVNSLTALAIGAGVVLLGPLMGEDVDPRLVMLGGVLHFAVLFDGNNAFGMDGPAIWAEVATGADGGVLARGKVMSSMVVMLPPAVLLPLALAALTDGWQWLPAGWLVGIGSVTAAAGVAVASATLAPVAMPDSPNPLAAGDTGQGCVAGLMLAACMAVLAIVSLPVAAGIYVASTSSPALAAAVALASPVIGLLVLWGGIAVATSRLRGAEEQLVQKVTPAR